MRPPHLVFMSPVLCYCAPFFVSVAYSEVLHGCCVLVCSVGPLELGPVYSPVPWTAL